MRRARPAGLLFPQSVRARGLSASQVRAGSACLRDIIAENGRPPLIWTRADGYLPGAEPAALPAYERAVLTEKLTEFRRFLAGTVAPHATAHLGDKWGKHIIAQLNSIEVDSRSRRLFLSTGGVARPTAGAPTPTSDRREAIVMRRRRYSSDTTDAEWALIGPP